MMALSARALLGVFFVLWLLPSVAEALPVIDKPVTDLAHVFTPNEVSSMSAQLVAHHKKTGVQMAVLTIDTKGSQTIEDYALAVANKWGGGKSGRNDGVLLVLAINDRESRLEIGRGLEAVVSDGTARKILASSTQSLRQARYGEAASGIIQNVVMRTNHLKAGAPIGRQPGNGLEWFIPLLVLVGAMGGVASVRPSRALVNTKAGGPIAEVAGVVAKRSPASARLLVAPLVFVGAPLAIGLVYSEGILMWLAMPIVWLGGAAMGAFNAATYTGKELSVHVAAAIAFPLSFIAGPNLNAIKYTKFFSELESHTGPILPDLQPMQDGLDVLTMAGFCAFGGLTVWMLIGWLWLTITGQHGDTIGPDGKRIRSSSSSSSGGSSYRGGGGSFGGGGASGRW